MEPAGNEHAVLDKKVHSLQEDSLKNKALGSARKSTQSENPKPGVPNVDATSQMKDVEKVTSTGVKHSDGRGNLPLQNSPQKSDGTESADTVKVKEPRQTGQTGSLSATGKNKETAGSGTSSPAKTNPHSAGTSPIVGQSGQEKKTNSGFFWQLDSHGFPCAKYDCEKRCNSWDGASVICPKCGPYSEIRYCGEEHLYEDIKSHWINCGKMTFKHPCRASTIPQEQKEGPPLMPNRHNWDTPERHRQAVYHAANTSGDYFIFADWTEFVAAGQPANSVNVRCTSRLLYTVKIDDLEEKDRFRRVLGIALFSKNHTT
jgi:hypothetical protein